MLNIEIKGNKGNYRMDLPTSIDELTNEYFADCAKQVEIAPNYALVGIVYREKLSIVFNAARKRDGITTGVIPVFIKAGESDSSFVNNLKLKDKLIITGSALSLGIHVNIPNNELSIEKFLSITEGDNELRKKAFNMTAPVLFVDFKILPVCDINAAFVEGTHAIPKYCVKTTNTITTSLN